MNSDAARGLDVTGKRQVVAKYVLGATIPVFVGTCVTPKLTGVKRRQFAGVKDAAFAGPGTLTKIFRARLLEHTASPLGQDFGP